MIPMRIEGFTREMGKHQDEYFTVAIRDVVDETGTPYMVSAWEPTPQELATLQAGGSVQLWIMGTQFPPVALVCKEPPE